MEKIHYEVSTKVFDKTGTQTLNKFEKVDQKPDQYQDVKALIALQKNNAQDKEHKRGYLTKLMDPTNLKSMQRLNLNDSH